MVAVEVVEFQEYLIRPDICAYGLDVGVRNDTKIFDLKMEQ